MLNAEKQAISDEQIPEIAKKMGQDQPDSLLSGSSGTEDEM